MNEIKDELLKILHNPNNGLPSDPQQLHAKLLAFKQTHQHQLRKVIKEHQWDKLCHVCDNTCPPACSRAGVTDSSTFDVTLIVILIRHFNLATAPINGWNKLLDPNDQTDGAFVIRARDLRNVLNHSTTTDLNKTFQTHWYEAECILIGLKSPNLALFRALEKGSLDPNTKSQIEKMCKAVDGMITIKDNEIAINQRINQMLITLAKYTKDVGDLRLDVHNQQQQIDQHKNLIEKQGDRIDKNRAQIDQNKDEINAVKQQMYGMETRVEEIEKLVKTELR